MKLENKVYDVLKWVAILLLPAAAGLYERLAHTWGLPYASQIPDTINAIQIFLGVILGISTLNYKKDGEGK